ncbi:MAG: response regulator transcription factor [Ferruginibacter sp.]|nr:response regulator transcription factor [Cytophagales bacterium]
MGLHDIRVCLIEDDPVTRNGFGLLIDSTHGYQVINSYSNCEDAIRQLDRDSPDVVMMDIKLPGGMNGIVGIGKIKKLRPRVNIIVVTAYENDELVFQALCAGAGGYLTKNTPPARMLDAIREVQTGGAPLSTHIARMVVQSFQKNTNSPLSPRETEVLVLLDKGKSYHTIADELFVDKETIRTHIKNTYLKLEVHSKADAIEKARRQKLI